MAKVPNQPSKQLWLVLMLVLMGPWALGQDCQIKLRKARKLYAEGRIEEVPGMLGTCASGSGLNSAEQIEVHKLLTLCAIFEDNSEAADKYMLELLRSEPEYEPDYNLDPTEYIELYESFKTNPIFSLGLEVGANLSFVGVQRAYGVNNVEEDPGKYSSGGPGLQIGILFNLPISERFSANLELVAATRGYRYTNEILGFATQEMTEQQLWLDVPLTFRYSFGEGRVKPYALLGGSVGLLVNSNATISRSYADGSQSEVAGPDVDVKTQRRAANYWGIAGLGFTYKVPKGFLFFDARFGYNLQTMANPTERYTNDELLYQYYLVDDDFQQHYLSFQIGYAKSFFNPRKRKPRRKDLSPQGKIENEIRRQ